MSPERKVDGGGRAGTPEACRRGSLECDVCGQPATVERPPTRSRDLARYCDADAKRYLGWGDTFHRLT